MIKQKSLDFITSETGQLYVFQNSSFGLLYAPPIHVCILSSEQAVFHSKVKSVSAHVLHTFGESSCGYATVLGFKVKCPFVKSEEKVIPLKM